MTPRALDGKELDAAVAMALGYRSFTNSFLKDSSGVPGSRFLARDEDPGGHGMASCSDDLPLCIDGMRFVPAFSQSPEGLSAMLEFASKGRLSVYLDSVGMDDDAEGKWRAQVREDISDDSAPYYRGSGPTPGLALAQAIVAWKESAK